MTVSPLPYRGLCLIPLSYALPFLHSQCPRTPPLPREHAGVCRSSPSATSTPSTRHPRRACRGAALPTPSASSSKCSRLSTAGENGSGTGNGDHVLGPRVVVFNGSGIFAQRANLTPSLGKSCGEILCGGSSFVSFSCAVRTVM